MEKNVTLIAAATPKTISSLILQIAKDAGFFAKRGLEVDILETPERVQKIINDEAQFGIGPLASSVMRYNLKGADLKQIATIMDNIPMWLYASSQVHSIGDLKNKKVALHESGTGSLPITKIVLASHGVRLDAVKLISHLSFAAISLLLDAGEIDAGWFDTTYSYRAKKQEMTLLYNLGKELYCPAFGVIAKESFIESNPAAVKIFLMAVAESINLIRTDKAKTIRLIDYYYCFSDQRMIEFIYEAHRESLPTYIMRTPTGSDMAVIRALLMSTNPEIAGVNPTDTYDNRFMEELESSGFFNTLRK